MKKQDGDLERAICGVICHCDGKRKQRFTPRKKNSPWTELNKERVRRLEKLGLMTEAGDSCFLFHSDRLSFQQRAGFDREYRISSPTIGPPVKSLVR